MSEQVARRPELKPPAGHAKRLLELERGVALLKLRPDRHQRVQALYACAGGVALTTAVMGLWLDDDVWWGLLVALMFVGLGLLFGQGNRETRLHFARKLVVSSKGTAVTTPFTKLAAILAVARSEVIRARGNSYEELRFAVGLIVLDEADPLRGTLEAMRRHRAAVVRGEAPAAEEHPSRLEAQLEAQLEAHVLTLTDDNDEIAVWQASEWLAKQLDLPLIDACTPPTVVRIPEELDLPLGERLMLGLQGIDELDEPTAAYARVPSPPDTSVQWRQGKCTLTWRRNRLSEILSAVGFAVLCPISGRLASEEAGATFWTMTVVGLCLLPLAWVVAHWHGVNRLTVDRRRVTVTRGPFGKRLPALVTDRIEAIRVGGTRVNPLLSFVADQRVLRIPMTPPVAQWAKRHIERHLRAIYGLPRAVVPTAESGSGPIAGARDR